MASTCTVLRLASPLSEVRLSLLGDRKSSHASSTVCLAKTSSSSKICTKSKVATSWLGSRKVLANSNINGNPLLSASSLKGCSRSKSNSGRPLVVRASDVSEQPQQYGGYSQPEYGSNPPENARAQQAAEKLRRMAGYFRRLGSLGFWSQLVCTVVAAVILAFSIVITGQATSPVTLYLTSGGIVAAFLSVFWSFDYTRLSRRLRDAVSNPQKAPKRANVVSHLKSGLVINLVGMGATLLGLQATVGVLVAKALTSSYPSVVQNVPSGYSPVMALDVFLIQASANCLLSHFFGLCITLELLRSATETSPSSPPDRAIPKPA
eukprot:jgi/Mesen1/2691/ME000167S01846